MQTILGGTSRLSLITRRNEFFDNLVKKSDELKSKVKHLYLLIPMMMP